MSYWIHSNSTKGDEEYDTLEEAIENAKIMDIKLQPAHGTVVEDENGVTVWESLVYWEELLE